MNALVRCGVVADIPLLQQIECSAAQRFAQLPGLGWLADGEPYDADQHQRLMALGTHWVLEHQGQPVGFLAAERFGTDLHVWELDVALPHQGRGWGRALLSAAQQYAAASGVQRLTLTTFREVPWNAPFYRRFGFREWAAAEWPPRLQQVMARERALGLTPEERCVMQCPVTPAE